MDAARSPEYLQKTADAVAEFKRELLTFMGLHQETKDWPGRGIIPPLEPKDGVSKEDVREAQQRVSRAAGRAKYASSLTDMHMSVQGVNTPVDAVAAWQTITQPHPLLEPDNVLDIAEQIIGRLQAMIIKAEAELPPTTGVEAMHPTIWTSAKRLWLDGHYQAAVQKAAETLTAQVKARTGLFNMDATSLYGRVWSKSGPALRWPGDPANPTVSSMQKGLASYAPGLNMTVRNTATHVTDEEMTAQDALERLAALSLLARWVDECEDVDAP